MCQWQKLRSVTLRTFARRPRLQERGLESRGNHRDAPRSLSRAIFFRAATGRTRNRFAVGVAVTHKETRYDYDS